MNTKKVKLYCLIWLSLLTIATPSQAVECEDWDLYLPWRSAQFWEGVTNEYISDCFDKTNVNTPYNQRGVKEMPLGLAIKYNGKLSVIDILIQKGADVNATAERGVPALIHAAIHSNDPDILKSLIEAGADVNVKAFRGNSPLHEAGFYTENPAIIQVLIEHGANVNALNDSDKTPLHFALLMHRNPKVIEMLIDAGADINIVGTVAPTPLQVAIDSFNMSRPFAKDGASSARIISLIEAGADVNAISWTGNTPLHEALGVYILEDSNSDPGPFFGYSLRGELENDPIALEEYLRIIRALLSAGADVNILNEAGKSPLDLAIRFCSKPIIEELENAGAMESEWGIEDRKREILGVQIVRYYCE